MPDYAEVHLNLGLCYLLIGDYENGWREYEWRRKLIKESNDKLSKEWSGQNLENKTLLVLDEGADGNLIHFIRFIRELKKESCKKNPKRILLKLFDLFLQKGGKFNKLDIKDISFELSIFLSKKQLIILSISLLILFLS